MRLNGCRNATPLIALLDAEKLALKQTDEDRLQAVYDRGIKCLARHQLLPGRAQTGATPFSLGTPELISSHGADYGLRDHGLHWAQLPY